MDIKSVRMKRPKPFKDLITGSAYKEYMQKKANEPVKKTLIPFLEDDNNSCPKGMVANRPKILEKLKNRVLGEK